jgi:CBS domain-containing protein
MICPYCGFKNIPGSDECESCHEDLASLDGVVPRTKIEKVLMGDRIAKLQPREPISVRKETSVLEAVQKMNAHKIGCVLVMGNDRLEGVLTEHDVLMKALGRERDLSKVPAASIMTPDPETLSEDDTLAYAVNRMSLGSYRHIPILRNGKPVGMVSVRDVLRYLSKLFP